MNRISQKIILGMGLDSKDGHVRITKGINFCLYGGSARTHARMIKQMMAFNKKLDKINKTLDDISEKEFFAIARSAGIYASKKTGGKKNV